MAKGLLKYAERQYPMPHPGDASYEEWQLGNSLAASQIGINMTREMLAQITTDDAATMWSELTSRFEVASLMIKSNALDDLRSKKIRDGTGERLADHIEALQTYRALYLANGGSMADEEWRVILLMSFQGRFSVLTHSLSSKPSADLIIQALRDHGRWIQ